MDLKDIKTPTFEFQVPEIGTISVTPLYFTEKSRLARKFPRMEYVSERLICEALVLMLGKRMESPEGEQKELAKNDIEKITDDLMNHFAESFINLNPSLKEQAGPSKNAEKKEAESFMAYLKRLLIIDIKSQVHRLNIHLSPTATEILARDSVVSLAARTLNEMDALKPYSFLNSSMNSLNDTNTISYLNEAKLAAERLNLVPEDMNALSYLREDNATSRLIKETSGLNKYSEQINLDGFPYTNAPIEPAVSQFDYSPPIMHMPPHPGHETNEHIKDLKQEIKELKEVTKEQKDDSKTSSVGSFNLNRKMYSIAIIGIFIAIIGVVVAVYFGIKGNNDTKKASEVVTAGAVIDVSIKSRLDEQNILIILLSKTKNQKDIENITSKITHLSDEIDKLVASKQKIGKP